MNATQWFLSPPGLTVVNGFSGYLAVAHNRVVQQPLGRRGREVDDEAQGSQNFSERKCLFLLESRHDQWIASY